MKFGEKLALLRKQKALSVREVGNRVGVSGNTVSNYERNITTPRSKDIINALAELFELTPEELTNDSVDIFPEDPKNNVGKKVKNTVSKASDGKSVPAKGRKAPVEDIKATTKDSNTSTDNGKVSETAGKTSTESNKASSTARTFGECLSELRVDKGLRQQDMAERLGITLNAYRAMEKKDVRPETAEEYEKLAEILGCEAAYLTAGVEMPVSNEPKKTDPVPAEPENTEPLTEPGKPGSGKTESEDPESKKTKPAPTEHKMKEPARIDVEKTFKAEKTVPAAVSGSNRTEVIIAGKKTKLRVGKKAAEVSVSNSSIAKVKTKGKKLIVKGKNAGITTITAYGKKGTMLGSWIIQVK